MTRVIFTSPIQSYNYIKYWQIQTMIMKRELCDGKLAYKHLIMLYNGEQPNRKILISGPVVIKDLLYTLFWPYVMHNIKTNTNDDMKSNVWWEYSKRLFTEYTIANHWQSPIATYKDRIAGGSI